jgi:glucose/arabinose dehydrogenase
MGPGVARALRAASLTIATLLVANAATAQFALPTDFVDELVVAGLHQPVGMAFLPDGRLLVVERQTAQVRLIVNGALAAVDPVVTVPDVDASYGEEGLLGVAVDPGWPDRPYVYVQFTVDGAPFNRISRFTAMGDLGFTGDGSITLDPSSRYDVIEPPRPAEYHNGGTLRFGPDGMLYSSLGDATACNSQLPWEIWGKILRLDVSGLPPGPGGPAPPALITPSDNPFALSPDPDARMVWHFGLRNPFRFGIDAATGDMVIADVGGSEREELNYSAVPGDNFEWPIYEGEVPGPYVCQFFDSTRFRGPIHSYDHSEGTAVTGNVIYRPPPSATQPFPPEYDGDIFFCDFSSSWLRRLKRTGETWSMASAPGQPNATDWGLGADWVSDLVIASDGTLWCCRLGTDNGNGLGQIRRIRYAGTVSVPPPTLSPAEFRAPFPSPSHGSVAFDVVLAADATMSLSVHDVTGRRVRALVAADTRSAGPHRVSWDGRDGGGRRVAPGVYLARLSVAGHSIDRRLVLLD